VRRARMKEGCDKKGEWAAAGAFYGGLVVRQRGKGAGGSRGRRRMEGGKWGREMGHQARRGTALVVGIGPRPAGAGGAVAARHWRVDRAW
jgi:hypothetical protein